MKLFNNLCKKNFKFLDFSVEITKTLKDTTWMNSLDEYYEMEKKMSESFDQAHNKRWREGHLKKSFIYLLIDPRVSDNLPGQYNQLDKSEIWRRFLSSIFYVGKGKSSRPYCHLYDAMKHYTEHIPNLKSIEKSNNNLIEEEKILFQSESIITKPPVAVNHQKIQKLLSPKKIFKKIINQPTQQNNRKLERINEIWNSKKGVVCLHIFHNIIPAEAYTREASMIDCLGLQHLTNLKRGDYYGIAQGWNLRKRKELGIGLLHRAMQIYLVEGESQLMPTDLV